MGKKGAITFFFLSHGQTKILYQTDLNSMEPFKGHDSEKNSEWEEKIFQTFCVLSQRYIIYKYKL